MYTYYKIRIFKFAVPTTLDNVQPDMARDLFLIRHPPWASSVPSWYEDYINSAQTKRMYSDSTSEYPQEKNATKARLQWMKNWRHQLYMSLLVQFGITGAAIPPITIHYQMPLSRTAVNTQTAIQVNTVTHYKQRNSIWSCKALPTFSSVKPTWSCDSNVEASAND